MVLSMGVSIRLSECLFAADVNFHRPTTHTGPEVERDFFQQEADYLAAVFHYWRARGVDLQVESRVAHNFLHRGLR
jgi:hypothetical protein